MLKQLGVIDRFHLARLDRFLTFLKSTSEAEGNMLGRTVVLFGSGMNSGEGGEHSPKNIPTIIAGGQELGLQHGQHVAFDPDNHPPMNNVLLSMAHAMGVERETFADASGTLSEIHQ